MSAPAGLSLPTVAQIAPKRAEFAAKLGCSDEATQPAGLRRPTAQQIIDAARRNLEYCPGLGFVVDRHGGRRCAAGPMAQRLPVGNFNRVPVMVGHTKQEVRLMGAIFENDAGGKMTLAQG